MPSKLRYLNGNPVFDIIPSVTNFAYNLPLDKRLQGLGLKVSHADSKILRFRIGEFHSGIRVKGLLSFQVLDDVCSCLSYPITNPYPGKNKYDYNKYDANDNLSCFGHA